MGNPSTYKFIKIYTDVFGLDYYLWHGLLFYIITGSVLVWKIGFWDDRLINGLLSWEVRYKKTYHFFHLNKLIAVFMNFKTLSEIVGKSVSVSARLSPLQDILVTLKTSYLLSLFLSSVAQLLPWIHLPLAKNNFTIYTNMILSSPSVVILSRNDISIIFFVLQLPYRVLRFAWFLYVNFPRC